MVLTSSHRALSSSPEEKILGSLEFSRRSRLYVISSIERPTERSVFRTQVCNTLCLLSNGSCSHVTSVIEAVRLPSDFTEASGSLSFVPFVGVPSVGGGEEEV